MCHRCSYWHQYIRVLFARMRGATRKGDWWFLGNKAWLAPEKLK